MKKSLIEKINSNPWFARYYDFEKLSLVWLRDNHERQEIYKKYDFWNATVLDVWCNLWKNFTFIDNYKPKALVWIDLQITTELAKEVGKEYWLKNVSYYPWDLNQKNWYEKLEQNSWISKYDYSIFVSVYGTKELHNRDGILRDLIKNTNKTLFFEWHHLENHFQYSKILLRHQCLNFEFEWYLRDKATNETSWIRPFFTIHNSACNLKRIENKILETLQNTGRIIIGIEWLAGSGKTSYIKKLRKLFASNLKILVIDDLQDESWNQYQITKLAHNKIVFQCKNNFLKKWYFDLSKSVRDKNYDVVILSDYKLRKYIDFTDITLKVTSNNRENNLNKRWEKISDFSREEIRSRLFVTNNFYTLNNNG